MHTYIFSGRHKGCFSGGFTHPYVLGRVLRLGLLVGIELVYSPFYHPKSNGTVERFHQGYEQMCGTKLSCLIWQLSSAIR